MPDPYLTPDLVLTTYRGSLTSYVVVPKIVGSNIPGLSGYTQISWSWYAGTRDRPGTKALNVTYTGSPPNYITVVNVGSDPAVQVTIPAAASAAIAPGLYYAELWLTAPGVDPIMAGWVEIKHEQTTLGA